MIVDNEFYARKALVKLVSEWDPQAKLCEAENGHQALELALERVPDMMLVDVRMPVMDGIELCSRIRELGLDVDIVIVSGYADFSYAQDAIRFRVRQYLLKPVMPHLLYEVLDSARETLNTRQNGISGRKIRRLRASARSINANLRMRMDLLDANSSNRGQDIVDQTIAYIREHYYENLRLDYIASNVVFVNPSYLSRCIKTKTGRNFSWLLQRERMAHARLLLEDGKLSVSTVATMVGYSKVSYFIEVYKRMFGATPGKDRKV